MPIKIKCDSCSSSLTVSDKMAGKRGKCPKCGNVLSIPAAGEADDLSLSPTDGESSTPASTGGWGQSAASPLDDLLSEAGVKAAAEGPTCPSCHAEVNPDARLCIECGYDFVEGRKLRTVVGYDHGSAMAGMSETDKMLAKAEREIEETPTSMEEDDFGDGASSFLVAGLIGFAALVLIGIGILVIFLIDWYATDVSTSALIAMGACVMLNVTGRLWIIVVAFQEGVGHGLGCIFCECYLVVYGFMRFQGLWIPTVAFLLGDIGFQVAYMVLLGTQ